MSFGDTTYTLGGHKPGDFRRAVLEAGEVLRQADSADTIEFTGRPNSRVRIPRPPRPSLLRQLAALA